MLSHLLGRHVSRETRPVLLSFIREARCRKYSTQTPVGLFEELTERGFVRDVTCPQVLRESLESKRHVVYAGIDPTAQSLHIGHLIPLMCLLHFHIRGHEVVTLIGGATGLIGDPSGRTIERKRADYKEVRTNVNSLTTGVQNFFKRASGYAEARARIAQNMDLLSEPVVKSNLQWHKGISMLQFLRVIGVHARVNTMLNRESVRARLNSQQGLSFTELTYQLLQAYDFYHLHKHFRCTIQVGGSDQWGNILAGLDIIARIKNVSPDKGETVDPPDTAPDAFGITTPLLTTASGEKFGKSAGNAIWLDPNSTSVLDFYQYFIRVDDADVAKYLKLFTLLPVSEIGEIMRAHVREPEKRIAQKRLAAEVTEMVHTAADLAHAQAQTSLLFKTDVHDLTAEQITIVFQGDPRLVMIHKAELLGLPVIKLAAKYGLTTSTTAGRSLITSRGFYVNNSAIRDPRFTLMSPDLIDGRVGILRTGKDKLLILMAK